MKEENQTAITGNYCFKILQRFYKNVSRRISPEQNLNKEQKKQKMNE